MAHAAGTQRDMQGDTHRSAHAAGSMASHMLLSMVSHMLLRQFPRVPRHRASMEAAQVW